MVEPSSKILPPPPHEDVFDARNLRFALINGISAHPYLSVFVILTALYGAWHGLKQLTLLQIIPFYVLLITLASLLFLLGFVSAICLLQSHIERRTATFLRRHQSVLRPDLHSLDHHNQPSLEIVERFLSAVQKHLAVTTQQIGHLEDQNNRLHEQYQVLTTNLGASAILVDHNRTVTVCSPFTEVLTGFSSEEIKARGMDALRGIIRDGDRDRFERAWQVAELGEDILVRYQVRHRSGLHLWLETRFAPVHNAEGEVTAVMLVTIDVTDSLNYQKQIEEQNRDLSDFTSMVSHDLKAPIFTIKGMAAALLEDLSPRLKEEERQQLQYILDGGTRLEQLISSVLAYSKLSASPPPEGEVPLREVLKSVLNDLAGQIEAADARVVVPPTLPVLRGDALGFYQIFSNLIANSLKYASPTRKPVISIASFITEGGTVELTVSDNGIGIPNTKIDEVFRPFKRGNHLTIDGSGIGLACVKKLTERFGGTVRATSNEGDGTTMHLLFPLPHPGALAHLDPQRDAEKDRAQEQPVEL